MIATEKDIQQLNSLYEGCKVYQGELHDHARTGGRSDGKCTLSHWRGALEALHMDFAAILDHRGLGHMYLPEWEDGLFICGTEPGTVISDSPAQKPSVHYNMIFSKPEDLRDVLIEFPEYEFQDHVGEFEGQFIYPRFSTERFCELITAVKAHGGFFVHPHPKQLMISDDPLNYWFQDETGIEVFYRDLAHEYSQQNYQLWLDLLKLGKRVWACSGGDGHKCASNKALTTIYAEEYNNRSFLTHLRRGDFTCGSVGIRMCIGDTATGGKCSFTDGRLVIAVSDFHDSVYWKEHSYRVDVYDDQGIVFSKDLSGAECAEPIYLAMDTKECAFYRAEVFDTLRNLRIAVGNPIWNADISECNL